MEEEEEENEKVVVAVVVIVVVVVVDVVLCCVSTYLRYARRRLRRNGRCWNCQHHAKAKDWLGDSCESLV